jgi:hypothetical protein
MADPEYSLKEYHMTKISLVEYIFTPHRYTPRPYPAVAARRFRCRAVQAVDACPQQAHCHWAGGRQQQAQDQEEPA